MFQLSVCLYSWYNNRFLLLSQVRYSSPGQGQSCSCRTMKISGKATTGPLPQGFFAYSYSLNHPLYRDYYYFFLIQGLFWVVITCSSIIKFVYLLVTTLDSKNPWKQQLRDIFSPIFSVQSEVVQKRLSTCKLKTGFTWALDQVYENLNQYHHEETFDPNKTQSYSWLPSISLPAERVNAE